MNSIVCSRCGTWHAPDRPCLGPSALPVPGASVPLAPGLVVGGRFRILGIEHRSGMSTVYRAADQRNGSSAVALKEFSAARLPDADRDEALVWLTREASLLSTLDHPRLPRLLAAFSEGDRHYLAMPFIEGETLEELVARKGPQAEEDVLRWGHDLVLLLAYLHRQDPPIIHRDLKPANILLQRDGTLTLLDLGVARPLERRRLGTAIGTPGYAPPEQYQGLADERSDLYALGATLHRLLTAYDPEHAEPFRHPPVRDLNPAASGETAELVAHLLELAPAARPSGAGTVLGAIERAERAVEARATYPVHVMYGQMLAALATATISGAMIYLTLVSDAMPLGLPLALAPGLLCALPLLSPQLQRAIRRRPELASHRRRAAQMLLRAYVFLVVLRAPFAPWLMPLIAIVFMARFLLDSYRATGPLQAGPSARKLAP